MTKPKTDPAYSPKFTEDELKETFSELRREVINSRMRSRDQQMVLEIISLRMEYELGLLRSMKKMGHR